MWLNSKNTLMIDAELAEFIVSLAGPQPVCKVALPVDGTILHKLAAAPSPKLKQAWKVLGRQKFKRVPIVEQDLSQPVLRVTPALIVLAVILHNQIFLRGNHFNSDDETVTLHGQACLNSLSSPRTPAEILSFDLLLSPYCELLRAESAAGELDQLSFDLLNLSPFTSLQFLDLALPEPLARKASAYLPHWPVCQDVDAGGAWWRAVIGILGHPDLVAVLKNAWLELPENRLSCLGLGVFLEEIRRRGQYDDLILSFFESYEFLQKLPPTESDNVKVCLPDLIASQLRAPGDSLSGRRLNQVGNEYFLKFRALLEILAAWGGVPGEFRHLSHDFCFKRLLPLVALATITGGQRLEQATSVSFSKVKFS